jgi:hypothetical protein
VRGTEGACFGVNAPRPAATTATDPYVMVMGTAKTVAAPHRLPPPKTAKSAARTCAMVNAAKTVATDPYVMVVVGTATATNPHMIYGMVVDTDPM